MGAIIKLSIALSLDYLRERPAGGTRPRLLLGRGLKISRCASILTLGHHLPRALCVILIFWVKRVQPALKEFPPGLNDWPGCHSLRFGTRPPPQGGGAVCGCFGILSLLAPYGGPQSNVKIFLGLNKKLKCLAMGGARGQI